LQTLRTAAAVGTEDLLPTAAVRIRSPFVRPGACAGWQRTGTKQFM